jgi:hypothetical protein
MLQATSVSWSIQPQLGQGFIDGSREGSEAPVVHQAPHAVQAR